MKLPLPRFTIKDSNGDQTTHKAVHEVDVRELEREYLKLQSFARFCSEQHDICAYDLLGEICAGCRCHRKSQLTTAVN